jgi:hypothetical protein
MARLKSRGMRAFRALHLQGRKYVGAADIVEPYEREVDQTGENGLTVRHWISALEASYLIALLYHAGTEFMPVGIKSGQTIHSSFFGNLSALRCRYPDQCKEGLVVYGGDESQKRSDDTAVSWRDFSRALPGAAE